MKFWKSGKNAADFWENVDVDVDVSAKYFTANICWLNISQKNFSRQNLSGHTKTFLGKQFLKEYLITVCFLAEYFSEKYFLEEYFLAEYLLEECFPANGYTKILASPAYVGSLKNLVCIFFFTIEPDNYFLSFEASFLAEWPPTASCATCS